MYEKALKQQLISHLDKTLSIFISAYRKSYSTQHVLINLVEDWREKLDKDFVVGAILMDLSKAVDSIPNNLIIPKLHAYGFDENALVLIYSYLKSLGRLNKTEETYLFLSNIAQSSSHSSLHKEE